ncbi:sulfite exporter TauE/SafE family protein [Ramlibacter terrae]|uniref:Probable membrane transporter protein n=1 Tax=Ramlibacter terrae TaxID=2732511 RepID=A0ABX6P6S2_9BURK|nr:sulfite exporter TauE/SafE family protein [Ramlibacter terrae]
MEHPAIIVIGAAVAGFVRGLSGFGFSMTAIAMWAWVLDPQLAAVLAVFGALTGQVMSAFTVRRGWHAQTLLPFPAGGLAGLPLGLYLLPRLDVPMFKAVLGLVLVIACPLMFFAAQLPRITRGGHIADAVAGSVGGVMGGLGGSTGVAPTLWCTLRGYEKDRQRAVIQNFNLAMLSITFVGYLATGLVERSMLPLFAVVAPAMLVPAVLGARLYVGISELTFRKVVLGLLTASGAGLLASSIPVLLARWATPESARGRP